MPTYDYVCEACGHQEEIFQSMTERPKRTCTQCKARKFKRLIGTGAGFIFKGSGFYQTDYRSDSYKAGAKKDADAKKDAGAKKDADAGEGSGDPKSGSGSGGASDD